jgi:hypothetical protein
MYIPHPSLFFGEPPTEMKCTHFILLSLAPEPKHGYGNRYKRNYTIQKMKKLSSGNQIYLI